MKESRYTAKIPDSNNHIHYTDAENEVWHTLIVRQNQVIQNRACPEFIDGLDALNLPLDRIPQCTEVSQVLQRHTGWSVTPVPALISFDEFFELLANKQFPAATFIRTLEDLDYLQEPDMFHEIYGHCPLLTNPAYAQFVENYGKLALNIDKKVRCLLARLFWFTIEFGLIKTKEGFRIYGGGILSSKDETIDAIEDPKVIRKPLDIMKTLRTPYRIDIIQPIYFYINQLDDLFALMQQDLVALAKRAIDLGELPTITSAC